VQLRVSGGSVVRVIPAAELWIDEHRFTEDDGGVPTPEMRPLVLVRQIRFCGLWVVIGGVVAVLSPWVGIDCRNLLGLMATLIARFRRS
jgi:hypothetical protein